MLVKKLMRTQDSTKKTERSWHTNVLEALSYHSILQTEIRRPEWMFQKSAGESGEILTKPRRSRFLIGGMSHPQPYVQNWKSFSLHSHCRKRDRLKRAPFCTVGESGILSM